MNDTTTAGAAGGIGSVVGKLIAAIGFATPLLDLIIRLYVGRVFWNSGQTKIQDWETTLFLFQYEYSVPLLSPAVAAWLATAGELVLPVMLVLGLGTRIAALALFILNYVAVISYPAMGPVGVGDHVFWGFLLAVTFFHGPGKISLDYLISRKFLK